MITTRQTRLFRVADLRAFQTAIRRLTDHDDVARLRDCAVIVPTEGAGEQLRRTLENHQLPHILTRASWYDVMQARLGSPPRRLTDLEREVILGAVARQVAASEIGSPFRLRPGMLAEMLALYDELQRRDASVDTFERRLTRELARDADLDRGAERLIWQTRFLAASFRGYEGRRNATGAVDEHSLRLLLLDVEPVAPLRHIVVTVAERSVDAAGLWPADFDLLARLPHLDRIDVVATQATIAAGFLERLQKFMPGFEDAESVSGDADPGVYSGPILVAPADGQLFSVSRDREEELASIAVSLKRIAPPDLNRRAVVFKQPLPYVYLARDVFASAGIPYQTADALPLAAEPYAAALDLVFEFVTSNCTREAVVALLGSPQFAFFVDGARVLRPDVAALNRTLSEESYSGGAHHLEELGAKWRVAQAAAKAADELRPLFEPERPSLQLAALAAFLETHDCVPPVEDPLYERHMRAHTAVLSAIDGLRRAHQQLDDIPVAAFELAAMIRRRIEGQTFAPHSGAGGVQLLDAQAARYGEFDEVFVVGLIEGEWPQRLSKSIFYPASLLSQLDWPDSRMMLAGERAAFHDLATLSRRQVHLSTFQLENDSIVGPSVFLEDVDRLELRSHTQEPAAAPRIFVHQALTSDPVAVQSVQGDAAAWLTLRLGRSDASTERFHGTAASYVPPAYSISSLERYLQCPFRFFSERVLGLQEDPDDEPTLNPKELGIFVHEVFHRFFEEWKGQGHHAITPGNLSDAREI